MPASYNDARFHCEVNTRESGRRIVEHEFPKKELHYAEDMGRQAREFNVRGYCIVYPYDSEILLFRRDYRQARNLLIDVLEAERPGVLQLPTQPPQIVVCSRYRITEEERFGGYCAFVHDVPRVRHRSAALGAIRRHCGRADQRRREHARPGAARSVAGVPHRSGGRSMNRQAASEAAALVDRMLENLIATVPPKGRAGSEARSAIGDTRANAMKLAVADELGPPLDLCFNITCLYGVTLQQIESVRAQLDQETPPRSARRWSRTRLHSILPRD
ncbi:DNA circularization N-terminal domain-containing protein [Bradyrhizobium sp. USDA 3315]